MAKITFGQPHLYEFVADFLKNGFLGHQVSFDNSYFTIKTDQPVLISMLQRANDGQSFALPTRIKGADGWVMTGPNKHQLEHDLEQVRHFIVPTYSLFGRERNTELETSFYPQFRAFSRQRKAAFQSLGVGLFPDSGYFAWVSPERHRERLLESLSIWLRLAQQAPIVQVETAPTYKSLIEKFQSSLAAARWDDAAQTVVEIRRNSLSSASNLLFLKIQLLAQQQRWDAIWDMPEFQDIASIRIPRLVRAALLTAFHQVCLHLYEQKREWENAFNAFISEKGRLGKLLETRDGLIDGPVLRVFAYQAVAEQNRQAFEILHQAADPQTRAYLAGIATLLSPEEVGVQPAEKIAHQAMLDRDYDTAFRYAQQISEPVERVARMIQIAALSHNGNAISEALAAYKQLSVQRRAQIGEDIEIWLDVLQKQAPTTSISRSWADWFDALLENELAAQLEESAEHLKAQTDNRIWTSQTASALSERLLLYADRADLRSNVLVQDVLSTLLDSLLQHPEFPQQGYVFQNLYDVFFMVLFEQNRVNEHNSSKMVRLAGALLQDDPARIDQIAKDVSDWFITPIAILEPIVLEAMDLLADYSVRLERLMLLYRNWLEELLAYPGWEPYNMEVWLRFGDWLHADKHLLSQLENRLQKTDEAPSVSIFSQLPSGYRITIFSLRESSARRAKEMLENRNPNLDIRLSHEKTLTPQVEALARNSQIVVLVTTAMAHSLFYGVQPLLSKETIVYPDSAGTTSIIRAIEHHLQQPSNLS